MTSRLAATFGDVVWAPRGQPGVTLPLLPEGRLRSRRWRPTVAASLTGALLIVWGAQAGPAGQHPLANPPALRGWAGTAALDLAHVAPALWFFHRMLGAVRRSGGPSREL